jgi:hypothetical protein
MCSVTVPVRSADIIRLQCLAVRRQFVVRDVTEKSCAPFVGGVRGGATSRKVAGSVPDGVIGIFC